LRSVVCEI